MKDYRDIHLKEFVDAARGVIPPELIFKNGRVVNTFTCEIEAADVAVHKGMIVGLGSYDGPRIIDVKGDYLLPGFIDGHLHIESTMLSPIEFAKAVLPLGTTAVMADPHEIANVLGEKGIRYILSLSEDLPVDIFILLPSCVPATKMETSGAILDCETLKGFRFTDRVLGLAEVMNFPGVIYGVDECLLKIKEFKDMVINGHSPLLSGKGLNAYILTGPGSDHECTLLEEAREKLRRGMHIMIREGSQAKNLKSLLPLVSPVTSHRCLLVTDDLHPDDLLHKGHMNYLINMAIEEGLDPFIAIQMSTLNPARYFGLKRRGAIAPGFTADLLRVPALKPLTIRSVYKRGEMVYSDGKFYHRFPTPHVSKDLISMNIKPYTIDALKIKEAAGEKIRVIGVIENQIITECYYLKPKRENGFLTSDIDRDILKIAVVERHKATGNIGLGFVKGFGLKAGAIASSIAHDSHNIVAVGAGDEDIFLAIKKIEQMGGGAVIVSEGSVMESLPLPIAGLMSEKPIKEVAGVWNKLEKGVKGLGSPLNHPLMALSFMALPVIPKLKITDKGLIDVERFKPVGLFVEA